MRIVVVNQRTMARTFRELGHEVLELHLEPGPRSVPAALAEHGRDAAWPELLLEVERLSPRTILMGLGDLACPKLFWAIDVHLNSWWHRFYARQFDAVLCSQLPWVRRLEALGAGRAAYLPWFGSQRPWRPWAARGRALCLVARVTPERPVRKRMVEHLVARHGLAHLDGLDAEAMLEAYCDTCIVPNEAIASEVNFRLFEAASCGCAVLNHAAEGGVGHLFEPGAEVLEFADVHELDAQVRALLAEPRRAEAMGRAAWERVQREHLPGHRCAAILETAARVAGTAPRGALADAHAWAAVDLLAEGGMVEPPAGPLLATLGPLGRAEPWAFTGLVRTLWRASETGEVLRLLRAALGQRAFAGDLEAGLTASGAALRAGDPDLARAFWLGHARARGLADRGGANPVELLLAWAGECERTGHDMRPGLRFNAARTVPGSAMECLLWANELEPGQPGIMRRLDAVAARHPGVEEFRLSVLSWLGLREPGDWRLGLELGLVNLRAMRLAQGLEELALARGAALAKGAARRFDTVLAARGGAALAATVRGLEARPQGAAASVPSADSPPSAPSR
jgi:hypothetical protein